MEFTSAMSNRGYFLSISRNHLSGIMMEFRPLFIGGAPDLSYLLHSWQWNNNKYSWQFHQ